MDDLDRPHVPVFGHSWLPIKHETNASVLCRFFTESLRPFFGHVSPRSAFSKAALTKSSGLAPARNRSIPGVPAIRRIRLPAKSRNCCFCSSVSAVTN